MRALTILAMISLLLGACAVEDASVSTPVLDAPSEAINEEGAGFRAELHRIQGALMSGRPGSLCHVIRRHNGGAGLYRVVSMESFMEPHEELKQQQPRTYVRLERLEAWSVDAPKDPVARIDGGRYPDGVQGGFLVSLTVGEKIGVLLDAPTAENLGFYSLSQEGVFNDEGGRYSNGRQFTRGGISAAELAEVISDRADLSFEECRKDDVRSDMSKPHSSEEPLKRDEAEPPVVKEELAQELLAE